MTENAENVNYSNMMGGATFEEHDKASYFKSIKVKIFDENENPLTYEGHGHLIECLFSLFDDNNKFYGADELNALLEKLHYPRSFPAPLKVTETQESPDYVIYRRRKKGAENYLFPVSERVSTFEVPE